MKYLKILLFPILLPFYMLFFIVTASIKAVEKLLHVTSKLPDLFAFIFTLACGGLVYLDVTNENLLGLVTNDTNQLIIRVLIGVIAFIILVKLGILLCQGIWFLISLIIKGIKSIRMIFENSFFFIHRYYKTTMFAILNKEYAYTDNNVYKVSDIDKSRFKIVKIKDKNFIYPLALDYNVE